MAPPLSIIVPVLDESAGIVACLADLAPLRVAGAEVIVVDGGSRDGTPNLAAPHADAVLVAAKGRASQMNAGTDIARGDALLFLHADTRLPADALPALAAALGAGAKWGRFDVRIDGRHSMLRVVAGLINLRSRLSGIATGDQAIFVRRDLFFEAGRYPALPLMEDIALCDMLRRHAAPACLRQRVTTSGRRWEQHGVWRTILLMWHLRAAYRLGVAPEALARSYTALPRAPQP